VLIHFSKTTIVSITAEQNAIVRSESPFLRVEAFAGTGKTTTLVSYAAARPRERMIYIAFNKSIQLEAQRKFGANVKCITSHGLAFAKYGSAYNEAGKIVDRIRINQVIDALSLRDYPDQFAMYVADAALKMVNRYICSDAEVIDDRMASGLVVPSSGVSTSDVVFCAQKLWEKMCNHSDDSVGMVHDGYLKLYQLSGPELRYDRILFDEAQDANGVTAAIVDAQSCKKVIVGDSHQAIYSFRGAVNAMQMFKAEDTLYLTRSFRFGRPIANVANALLGTYKGEKRQIQGTEEPGSVGSLDMRRPFAVISRSNATLFNEAAELMSRGLRLHFVGGIQGYRMGDLMDTYSLFTGKTDRITAPHLRAFKDFQTAEDYATLSDDKELKSLIGVVKRHGVKIPGLVAKLKAADSPDSSQAHVSLTTAHKSKGLEWDQVRLTDDYMSLFDKYKKPRKIDHSEDEDVNILYVAATRARKTLQPFPELKDLMDLKANEATVQIKQSKMPEWARPLPAGSSRR
jgi:F-box protein 18 (helicase)